MTAKTLVLIGMLMLSTLVLVAGPAEAAPVCVNSNNQAPPDCVVEVKLSGGAGVCTHTLIGDTCGYSRPDGAFCVYQNGDLVCV